MTTSDGRMTSVVIAITLAKPGGATSFALGLARSLKQQGRSVTLLAGDGDWLFTECAKLQIPCHRIPSLGRAISPLRDLRSLIELVRHLRRLRPDALHLNSSKMGVLGALAGRIARIPRIIYCIGGWSFLESLPEHTRRLYTWAERLSAPLKDVIVCVHPGDAEEAKRLNIRGREETQVIPNGIDIHDLDQHRFSCEEARQLLGLPRDSYIFGTIGNFYPAKDLPRYLAACALLHAEHPTVSFALIGDGPERAAIETARTEHKLEDVVHLLGHRDEAARYLLAFDTFVFPSAKEGMAFALLEAMAAALPCVATDVGANSWVLKTVGWIIPAKDPLKLAEAMKDVYQHRLQATERGLQGRTEVETRFPIAETFAAHDRLLFPPEK